MNSMGQLPTKKIMWPSWHNVEANDTLCLFNLIKTSLNVISFATITICKAFLFVFTQFGKWPAFGFLCS